MKLLMAPESPVDIFRDILKGKYKARILIYLNDKTFRYTDIRRKFSQASERILIKQLKELQKEGLIEKKVTGNKPPVKSEYYLSIYGKTLCPILKKMWYWGANHTRQKKI